RNRVERRVDAAQSLVPPLFPLLTSSTPRAPTAYQGREMVVGVGKDHAFNLRATRRESLWNHRRAWDQRPVLVGQPSPVEVRESWPSERFRVPPENGSEPLRDRIQIRASSPVKEVVLELADRLRLKRALQLLIRHGLIGGHDTSERLGQHEAQGP